MAAHVVALYEAQLAALTTVHRECGTRMNWKTLATTHPPDPPPPSKPNPINTVRAAEAAHDGYQPGWLARLFGTATKRREELAAIELARAADMRALEAATAEHKRACEQIAAKHQQACDAAAETREFAAAVLKQDLDAYQAVLDDVGPFDELREVGVEVAVSFPNGTTAMATTTANERSVVPAEQESLTARGKLSSKKMPKARGNEIYQDYLCGAALRACRELFAALPLEWVIVTVSTDMLNQRTGHVETTPVLSLAAPRQTIEGLRYDALDPSDVMANFTCRMTFKKGAGMTRVEPLSVREVAQFDGGHAAGATAEY